MGYSRVGGRNGKTVAVWLILAILTLLCLAGLTMVNYQFSKTNPGGNDFLARWMGARFFLQGIQPYDERVSLETQQWIYGRSADPEKGEDLSRFAYPLYAMIFFGPFGIFDFTTARALWMTVLEVGTVSLAMMAAALGGWLSQRGKTAVWILFCLFGYFGFRAIINGNPIVLVSLFLAAAVILMGEGLPVYSGILLAFATIKPQIVVLPLLWLMVWCLSRKRYSVIASFGISLVVLAGISAILVPDWIILNAREILEYPSYTEPGTPAAVLGLWFGEAGQAAGWVLSLLTITGLLWIWFRNRRGSFQVFLLVMGVTVSAAPLAGIPFDPGNEYLLLLPLGLGLAAWKDGSWKSRLSWGAALGVIFFGMWTLFVTTVEKGPQPVQHPVLLFPLPFLLLVWFGIWFRRRKSAMFSGKNTDVLRSSL